MDNYITPVILLAVGILLILQLRKRERPQTSDTTVRQLTEENAKLREKLSASQTELNAEKIRYQEKLQLLKRTEAQMTNEFKVLAEKILKENSRTFTEQNKTGIGEVLNPLKERLNDFQKKIQDNYETAGKERHALKSELHKLMELNTTLSQEASNLAKALKGDSKVQGDWGETILERILETAGLREGEGYTKQESHVREDGRRVQPDVVIHMPQNRFMVIDSKVSLNAWNHYTNTDDEAARESALKDHLVSIRNHIKGLSEKKYENLHKDRSPDFVIMFIPIESAFILPLSRDGKLWEYAWSRNVLLVTSSTLLFVMRIVTDLWRQEKRNQNASEIADRGKKIYDKLAGFIEDFEKIGKQITSAGDSFQNAQKKLTYGQGNLVWQAQQLKQLGISNSKKIPGDYSEKATSAEITGELPLKPETE